MNKITYNISLRKVGSKHYLRADIRVNGERDRISLSYQVDPLLYNKETQTVDKKHPKASDINTYLEGVKSKLFQIKRDYLLIEKECSLKQFVDEFEGKTSRKDFIIFYEKEMERRLTDNVISESTRNQDRVTLNKLKQFQSNIRFSEITKEFLERFNSWHLKQLMADSLKKEVPLVNNGINTRHHALKNIRTYLNVGIEQLNLNIPNPFKTMKIKRSEGNRKPLTQEEVKSLFDLYNDQSNVLSKEQRNSLGAFLFSCHTALRISDIRKVTHSMIDNDILTFQPYKTRDTGKIQKLPILTNAFQFVTRKTGVLFLLKSDQKINLHLKLAAIQTGIKKNLTYHTARHTFATIFIELGGDVVTLKGLMGHSDIRTTMLYVKLAEERNKEKMEIMNQVLNQASVKPPSKNSL